MARVKADWGAESAGWFASWSWSWSRGFVGDGVRDSGMVDCFGGISGCSFVKPSPGIGLRWPLVVVFLWGGSWLGFVTALS